MCMQERMSESVCLGARKETQHEAEERKKEKKIGHHDQRLPVKQTARVDDARRASSSWKEAERETLIDRVDVMGDTVASSGVHS